jgi:RNA methyltransferase, TrmH family
VERITSHQNPKIKNLLKLHKASERKAQQLFLVEGLKEIKLALGTMYHLHSLFWCSGLGLSEKTISDLVTGNADINEITPELFKKVAYREGSDGLLAVFHQKKLNLHELVIEKNPLIVVIESVEKPGNLGAILRTADAAAVSAVIICDPKTDIFNPNIIRSSVGCLFTNKIVTCTNNEALKWLKEHQLKIYASAIDSQAQPYHLVNLNTPAAVVFGSEADGLTDFWMKNCDSKIIIPMLGTIDSLNVAASVAVIIYESMRQRGFNR